MTSFLAMAAYPGVVDKATTRPIYNSDRYPYRNIHPYLRRVYDAFGPKRIFWGSDITRLPGSYRQAVTVITEEMPWLSEENKTWIMGRGICAWLGWPLP
jgi:predicted TIM-barrel fold metal-dependent hydrolase